jgi:hypothetical protein
MSVDSHPERFKSCLGGMVCAGLRDRECYEDDRRDRWMCMRYCEYNATSVEVDVRTNMMIAVQAEAESRLPLRGATKVTML